MIMNNLEEYKNKTFDEIKHIDEYGNEYWYARELMTILQYSKWQNFEKIINKAVEACKNSKITISEHFTDVRKTLEIPNNAVKEIIDYKLSRYACYLIAQNGDSRKKTIALAQTYFAVQTKKQLFFSCFFCTFNYFFSFVCSTFSTYSMWSNFCSTFWTFYSTVFTNFIVSSSFSTSSFTYFSKWYSHVHTSFL